jgi:hypothetical protein
MNRFKEYEKLMKIANKAVKKDIKGDIRFLQTAMVCQMIRMMDKTYPSYIGAHGHLPFYEDAMEICDKVLLENGSEFLKAKMLMIKGDIRAVNYFQNELSDSFDWYHMKLAEKELAIRMEDWEQIEGGTTEICVGDVKSVAESIGKTLTREQIVHIMMHYDGEAENDSGANWRLVVENMVYSFEPKKIEVKDKFLTIEQIASLKDKKWDVIPNGCYLILYAEEYSDDSWVHMCEILNEEPTKREINVLIFGKGLR